MGKWEIRQKKSWISTLKIQNPVHVPCTASELARGQQAPTGLAAGGAGSKQYTRKELCREAKCAHTWDSHPVQERDKWTPSPCCSLFLMTLYSHNHPVQQLNCRQNRGWPAAFLSQSSLCSLQLSEQPQWQAMTQPWDESFQPRGWGYPPPERQLEKAWHRLQQLHQEQLCLCPLWLWTWRMIPPILQRTLLVTQRLWDDGTCLESLGQLLDFCLWR